MLMVYGLDIIAAGLEANVSVKRGHFIVRLMREMTRWLVAGGLE